MPSVKNYAVDIKGENNCHKMVNKSTTSKEEQLTNRGSQIINS
jgi:hypothetical protein